MAEIRALERADLPAVAKLVGAELSGWRRDAATLEHALLDHPWADEGTPSLVAVEGGRVIGSVGAQYRRLRFEGRELIGVSVSHLVVSRDGRGSAAGALLIRRLLSGPQDLTWTDDSTPQAERIWRMFGAEADHARAAEWLLVLRRGAWWSRVPQIVVRPARRKRTWFPLNAVPLHALGLRPGVPAQTADPELTSEEVTPEELAAVPPPDARGVRLQVAHDAASVAWGIEHLRRLGRPPVIRLVRRGDVPIGWYAWLPHPLVCRVVHVAAAPADVGQVAGRLVADARQQGVVALAGRVEPHLDAVLRSWSAGVSLGQRPLLHARDPELRAACASSSALLTELDLVDSARW
jgi:hypothetical protein